MAEIGRAPLTIQDLIFADVFKPISSTAIGTEATIWTPAGGKKFRLMGMDIAVSVAVDIVIRDNTAGTIIYQTPTLVANEPYGVSLGNGKLSAAADNVLTFDASGAANVIGTIWGTEE